MKIELDMERYIKEEINQNTNKEINQDIEASSLYYLKTPLWNDSLPLSERLDYLIRELTLEEKIQCLTVRAPEIKRLGIKSFLLGGEAAHGVEARHDQKFNKGTPVKNTIFTQPIGMSATWDTELIEKAGAVTGIEARVIYNKRGDIGLSRWAPTVDMERDPRWGRTEEGYGEDPYLTGKMSSAYVQGLQGSDSFYLRCGATLKHFYANNEERDRTHSSSSLDIRNKQEYYLEPFRRAITEGKAEAVMTSYNEINGIPAIVNNEVQELLKNQWGLKGHVVCDMGDMAQTVTEHKYFKSNAETLATGLKCGIDSFNDPEDIVIAAAREALEKGLICEEDLNRSIRNTFSTKIRLGLYDAGKQCPYSNINDDRLNCREHREVCLEVAKKAMVLLKNKNQLVPLDRTTKETIAVVGPLAKEWYKDWYSGLPVSPITPIEGIRQEFASANLLLADGIDRVKIRFGERYLAVNEDGTCFLSDIEDAEVFEHTDWGENKHTLRASSIQKFLSTNMDGKSIIANQEEVFSWYVQEVFSFHAFDVDTEGGTDKFTIKTWNQMSLYVSEEGKVLMGEDIKEASVFSFDVVTNGIEQAVDIVKSADKVIAIIGCHPIISCKEETDREDILLPQSQRKLLQKVKEVNPNIILALITNYPYAIDWEQENLPAILTTASGSQELGTAIAKAITGEYPPAGRLNMTWYKSSTKLPPMREYDIIHGKRTYQYFDGAVLYPFGYGLSYTEFSYHDLQVYKESNQIKEFNQINVTLIVKNIGVYDGEEVVQLYVRQLYSRTKRPRKQLKGFQRVSIRTGDEIEVRFVIPTKELEYYDVVTGSMVLEESDYVIQIGASSEDIRLETTVHIDGTRIAARDMQKPTPCDHYDGYDNLYLHLGHDGKPCMLPKNNLTDKNSLVKGIAIYNDANFKFIPKIFRMDVKAEEAGVVIVRLGNIELVNIAMNTMEDYKVIEVPIESVEFMLGENLPLLIEIIGNIRVVEFTFL